MLSKEPRLKGDDSKAWVAQQKLKIAIDGPAGAGKSTVAQLVAREVGYLYIDTGAMYRAATLLVLRAKIPLDHQKAMTELIQRSVIELQQADPHSPEKIHVLLNNEDVSAQIRSREVTAAVSAVSSVMLVRELLVDKQRKMAEPGAVILDGRDIGTVVMPDADMKIFLTASPQVRAQRRYDELVAIGENVDYDTILHEIVERDRKDTNRAIAPLRQAQDAVMILSDNMTISQVVITIIKLCDKR
jgi:cytidylate kinase